MEEGFFSGSIVGLFVRDLIFSFFFSYLAGQPYLYARMNKAGRPAGRSVGIARLGCRQGQYGHG